MSAGQRKRAVRLPDAWLALLEDEFDSDYMRDLSSFLRQRRAAGARIFPPASVMFHAFWMTPPDAVQVVILGQDPYHSPGQAQGLSFSVPPGVPIPPSLRNIYQELEADLQLAPPGHGCLLRWAERGVLLLNSVLSVEAGQPGSHAGRGWEQFTDRVIDVLARDTRPRVFMLWGAAAQKKGSRINTTRHCVLRAPHPSPLSAYRGFFGCRHFSAANAYLSAKGQVPIDWTLPPPD